MCTETSAMERPGAKRAGVRREVSTRAVWIVLLALLVLVLGACGDSDSTAGTTVPDRPESPSTPVPEEPECSAEALWAAAPQSDLAEGSRVTAFACTPGVEAIASGWAATFAWARVEAPEADGAYVLYMAQIGDGPEDEGGGLYFADWEVLTWGSDDIEDYCSEEIPAEACEMLGWGNGDQSPETSEASAATSTVPDRPKPTSAPVSEEADCSAEALLATAQDIGIAEGPEDHVLEFACTPFEAGDLLGGWAWAMLELEEARVGVFYTSYEGSDDEGHVFGEWEVLTWGDVDCYETEIPIEACEMLGRGFPDGPEPTSAPVPEEPDCSAEALLAAAQNVDFVEGSRVTAFACTPASAGDLYGGYAWALVEAPEADGADFLYTAYVGQGDEGPVFGEWEVLTWGTDVDCDQTEIPAEACDMLGW